MKTQVTKKRIMDNFENVIKVGYCELQHALKGIEPYYYTAGVHGWNADVYIIDSDTVIVTGYRPFGNMTAERWQKEAVEQCARDIAEKARDYEQAQRARWENLDELINVVAHDMKQAVLLTGDGTYKIFEE